MKKVLYFILIFGLGIVGCSDNTNLTGPEKVESQKSFLKISPTSSGMLMKTSVTKEIDGEDGGLVPINLETQDEEYGAKGWLYFPRESFEGEEDIAVSIVGESEKYAALDFSPSGIDLSLPAHLTIKFNGVEFDDDGKIDFEYIAEDGSLESVDYRKLIVNREAGIVIVIDAKLDHFSRYGFTK